MYKRRGAFFLLMMIMPFLFTSGTYSNHGNNQACIRFHVIANSDSPQDQAVKLMVRDRLLAEYGALLGQADSLGVSRHIIEERLRDIEASAQQETDRHLPGYKVRASLGHFDFPTKAYGDMLLPAGNYEALRITIGEGKGANWWCIMFPPLCFVDITHGTAKDDGDGGDETGDWETGEDISEQPSLGDDVHVVYRFKIAEWWEKAKEIIGY